MCPWPREPNFDQYGSVGDELRSQGIVLVSTEGAADIQHVGGWTELLQQDQGERG